MTEQEQIENGIKSLAREEVVALLDILIRIFEKGELKDPRKDRAGLPV